jgi:hypothetical protein
MARWAGTVLLAILGAATFFASGTARAQSTACGTTSWQLTAGQHINVGSVTVSNDLDNLYISYNLTYPGASFGTLHAWVGNDIANVPANNQGTPVPGQFPYKPDATGLTTYTITVPFQDLLIQDVAAACPLSLVVVTHAEVTMDSDGDGTLEGETAFGGDTEGTGNRWWFYGTYKVCCDFGPPPVEICNTAFGKGGYVFTTDRKSNPENLPSLGLSRNRWGWATNLVNPGSYVQTLWAGAGLNRTLNGVAVGTVTIDWDGANANVTYAITAAGYSLKEAHLYAGDGTPTTVAPGQYGNTAYYDLGTASASFSVPVADTNGDGIWLIAHSVVCR